MKAWRPFDNSSVVAARLDAMVPMWAGIGRYFAAPVTKLQLCVDRCSVDRQQGNRNTTKYYLKDKDDTKIAAALMQ